MNIETLSAALNLAWAVASSDEMHDAEWDVLFKEMKSFNLTEDQQNKVIDRFKAMDVLEAVNVIMNSDNATRDEAEALVVVTMLSDAEFSDKEKGAWSLMRKLCKFRGISYEDSRKILGF